MPIYEYECQACHQVFEFLQLPTTKDKPECPACHGTKLEKVISSFGFSTASTRKSNAKKSIAAQKAAHKEQAVEEHKEYHKHHDH
jgi:putative FmdB family regulatory protein